MAPAQHGDRRRGGPISTNERLSRLTLTPCILIRISHGAPANYLASAYIQIKEPSQC